MIHQHHWFKASPVLENKWERVVIETSHIENYHVSLEIIDMMQTVVLAAFRAWGKELKDNLTIREMQTYFLFPNRWSGIKLRAHKAMSRKIRDAWNRINVSYQNDWCRDCYEEEREIVVEITLKGIDLPKVR